MYYIHCLRCTCWSEHLADDNPSVGISDWGIEAVGRVTVRVTAGTGACWSATVVDCYI